MKQETISSVLPSRQELKQVFEEYQGRVLADQEVINLVTTGCPTDIATAIQWFGSEIAEIDTPIFRFSQVLADNFDKLKPEEQEELLLGGARFVLGEYRRKLGYTNERWGWIDYEHFARFNSISTLQKNTGELLLRTLTFTDGDVQKARRLLRQIGPKRHANSLRNSVLWSFYGPVTSKLFPENKEFARTKNDYIEQNPKIVQLAFWLDTDFGGLSPNTDAFYGLLESGFPAIDEPLKTQIMIFLSQQMARRKISKRKYADIKIFLARNQRLCEDIKKHDPNSPFLPAFDLIRKVISLDELLEKTRGGRITAEDLVDLLKNNPDLISYITVAELEKALDKTKEHGLALRIERLIKEKNLLPDTED